MALTPDESAALRDSVRASVERFGDADRVVTDLGATDLLEDALPALSIFFEEFGRAGLANNLADVVARHTMGLDAAAGPAYVYPTPHRASTSVVTATDDSSGLSIDGVVRVPSGEMPSQVFVVTTTDTAIVVPIGALAAAVLSGFDSSGGWLGIGGDVAEAQTDALPSDAAPRAIALVRLALGSEMLGVAAKINTIAIEHVTSRRQFGKALGSFQTVRHRLAETHVAIQAAQSVLTVGWSRAEPSAADLSELETYAKAAKALAGRAVETAIRHSNQVCGGMGLTWEHPLPGFVRRATVLNVLLGSPVDLAADIGQALAAGEALPVPDPLIADGVPAMVP